MQPTRDSSVWRSLAVAFGDGLAFGVGMKLTQAPARSTGAAPETTDVAERLEYLERRLAQVELAPAAASQALPPAGGGAFDQKVLEAVVKALDARLLEQAGQVERRLTELEAKIAIELQALRQQDHSIAKGVQTTIAELQQHFSGRMDAFRKDLEESRAYLRQELAGAQRATTEMVQAMEARATISGAGMEELRRSNDGFQQEIRQEIDAVHRGTAEALQAVEARSAEMRQDMRQELNAAIEASWREAALSVEGVERRAAAAAGEMVRPVEERMREEVRHSIGRATSLIASASEAALQDRLAPLDRRISENNSHMAELLNGIGALCRETAERMTHAGGGTSHEPPSGGTSHEPPGGGGEPKQEHPAATEPPPEGTRELATANGSRVQEIPTFGDAAKPSRLWRIPLVSSLAALGGFAGTHLSIR